MRQGLFAVALLLAPGIAAAQEKPDVVLIPRDVAQTALNWIATPDPTMAVRLYGALQACIQNNPHDGTTMRMGPDQCPAVTEAIAARSKEIADLKAKAQKETSK